MTAKHGTIIVMGLPKAGKTTFLAALWHVTESEEVCGSLRLESLDGGEHQHLNEIRSRWADCDELPHTRYSGEQMVSMKLLATETGATTELQFCDLSGESFERQWAERFWSPSYEKLVVETNGLLLLIHPSHVKEGLLIRDAGLLIESLPKLSNSSAEVAPEAPPAAKIPVEQEVPPEPLYAGTQVQLVELLQFVQKRRRADGGFRVGVVVSAWDIVKRQTRATPEEWVEKRLPLLHQYLTANGDEWPFLIFGISAQGGELSDAQNLRQKARPSDRILVVKGRETSSDISAPVRWVMGLDN
jgi:hypothetical protein